eukprot:4403654-Alexandrium_andersonii.AAC.1
MAHPAPHLRGPTAGKGGGVVQARCADRAGGGGDSGSYSGDGDPRLCVGAVGWLSQRVLGWILVECAARAISCVRVLRACAFAEVQAPWRASGPRLRSLGRRRPVAFAQWLFDVMPRRVNVDYLALALASVGGRAAAPGCFFLGAMAGAASWGWRSRLRGVASVAAFVLGPGCFLRCDCGWSV